MPKRDKHAVAKLSEAQVSYILPYFNVNLVYK